ncbi:MAG TPA: class I SAM-dependent methyltransferase [Allosphingosinicella sp.]|nr:class I SAM-dependent methyltransferase [Allosphingosinicella sp.]
MKRVLPAPVFHLVRDLPYALRDSGPPAAAGLPMPRLKDQYDGPRGYDVFERNGQEAFAFYRDAIGIRPHWKVLDIGSGIGRKTRHLVRFLDEKGLYVGMDIDERGVKWCSENLSPLNKRFVFFKLNVYNKFYNPSGRITPDTVVLPFPDEGFDLVALWSVFTHMHTADIAHYLREISRVLKPGGKIAASYYIMDERTKRLVADGTAGENIVHPLPGGASWTTNPNIPEDLLAVDEQWLRGAYEKAGLSIVEPIMSGHWSGHAAVPAYGDLARQDIVVAAKPA